MDRIEHPNKVRDALTESLYVEGLNAKAAGTLGDFLNALLSRFGPGVGQLVAAVLAYWLQPDHPLVLAVHSVPLPKAEPPKAAKPLPEDVPAHSPHGKAK